jgi:hypothetical protein
MRGERGSAAVGTERRDHPRTATILDGVLDAVVCRIEDLSPGGARISVGRPWFELGDRVTLAFDLERQGFALTAEVRGIDHESVRLEFVGNSARSIELLTRALR